MNFVRNCPDCEGSGSFADHSPACYSTGECVGECPVQTQCERCGGEGTLTIEMPKNIERLDRDARGYPIPWFVDRTLPKVDFRIADARKILRGVREARCWTCGRNLFGIGTFAIGPMCSINRISAEPPNHRACAEFSVQACPWLSTPGRDRREGRMPDDHTMAGRPILRNPGVTLLWTADYTVERAPNGVVFRLKTPSAWSWWSEGRTATRAEVDESIESGLPLLRAAASDQSPAAMAMLDRAVEDARRWLPDALHIAGDGTVAGYV